VDTTAHAQNGSVQVGATNTSSIYCIAGAVGAGKQAGIGVAIAFNYIAPVISAYITDSRLIVGDSTNPTTDSTPLTVSASNTATIDAASAGGAGAEKVAVAGALSVNIILNTTQAYIAGAATNITSTGDVVIETTDSPSINSFTGNVAGAGKVAVGASIAYNLIDQTILAYIDGATVESTNGDVRVSSLSNASIIGLAVGGFGAARWAWAVRS